MARITDFVYALKQVGPIGFVRRVLRETMEDHVFTNAAAMAYAWVFAVFPFLVFLLTLLPYLPVSAQDATKKFITDFMYQSGMTYSVVALVLDPLNKIMAEPHGGFLSFGLLLTLYAASGGMNTTMSALDEAFEVEKPRPFLIKRLWAIGLTLFTCAGVVVILVALPVTALVLHFLKTQVRDIHGWIGLIFDGPIILAIDIVRYAIGLFAMQLMIGIVYRFGPSHSLRLRFLSPGAIFATLGWIATGAAMRFYFTRFAETSYSKTYGAVAGMVIMLLVFYLDGIIVLIGAEVDSEVERCKHHPDGMSGIGAERAVDSNTTAQQIPNPT